MKKDFLTISAAGPTTRSSRGPAGVPVTTNGCPCFPRLSVVLVALIGAWSVGCRSEVKQQVGFVNWKPAQTYKVRITGRDFRWHICYPGPDGKLGTPDDIQDKRHLHLPRHTSVRLELHSDDYVYSLSFPHWNKKEIAVPELRYHIEFRTHDAGTFDLRGNQMCGYTHPELLGQLTVHSHREFDAWLDQRRRRQQGQRSGEH